MQYRIYLHNSCTKETSVFEGGFIKEGSLTAAGAPNYKIDHLDDYYAGTQMTFDCKKGSCRFDEICVYDVVKDDEKCFDLAKGRFTTDLGNGLTC